MGLIQCKECGKEISRSAESCPHCGTPGKRSHPVLVVLLVLFLIVFGLTMLGHYANPNDGAGISRRMPRDMTLDSKPVDTEPVLELEDFHWQKNGSYAISEGIVKNTSLERQRSIRAVVTFFGENERFITSDDSYIEYSPILPGQKSPFKVYTNWNPAMKTARIDFVSGFGQPVRWRKADTE